MKYENEHENLDITHEEFQVLKTNSTVSYAYNQQGCNGCIYFRYRDVDDGEWVCDAYRNRARVVSTGRLPLFRFETPSWCPKENE